MIQHPNQIANSAIYWNADTLHRHLNYFYGITSVQPNLNTITNTDMVEMSHWWFIFFHFIVHLCACKLRILNISCTFMQCIIWFLYILAKFITKCGCKSGNRIFFFCCRFVKWHQKWPDFGLGVDWYRVHVHFQWKLIRRLHTP